MMSLCPAYAGWLALLGATVAFSASATCRAPGGDAQLDHVFDVAFTERADVTLGFRSGSLTLVCDAGETQMEELRQLSGMKYVRDVPWGSRAIAAYEMDSTSPLLAFSYSYGGCEISDPECPIEEVEEGGVPLRDGVPSRYSLNGARKNVTMQVIAFSRGGPMHDVARRPAGSLRTTSGGTGGFHRFNLGFRFRAQTCAVTPQNVDLDPVDAVTLQRNGSAGEKSFNVRVSCAASGRRLVLELVDVHDPASTSNTLKAAPGSTANGVAVQILSGGNPVRMKAPWTHGAASGSTLPVPFSARYLRTTGTLRTGSIRGEATLLADYY